tara:strand:- start:1091 stop:2215 length:1125 start_codon:yes stop_codon:yes gene_type:complete
MKLAMLLFSLLFVATAAKNGSVSSREVHRVKLREGKFVHIADSAKRPALKSGGRVKPKPNSKPKKPTAKREATAFDAVAVRPDVRTSLLLLASSQVRDLYNEDLAPLCCKPEESGAECSFEWAAPRLFAAKVTIWNSGAGVLCTRQSTNLAAAGYLIHYGVSSTPPYHRVWLGHGQPNWGGLGWSQSQVTKSRGTTTANSAALAVEAAWRFATRAPDSSRVVVVYSSLAWDLARYADYAEKRQPRQPNDVWADEWRANYSKIMNGLVAALRLRDAMAPPGAPPSLLVPMIDYDIGQHVKFYRNATPEMVASVQAHQEKFAFEQGLASIDGRQALRDLAAREADTQQLMDANSHPCRKLRKRIAEMLWKIIDAHG